MVFDASTYEIWGSLLNGGCLCLIDKEDLIDHVKLKKIITEKHIDTALFTVALFNQLVSEDISVFEKLKIILIGGDKLSRTHVNKLRENNSRIKIINAYGPTENGVITTTYDIEKVEEKIFIGRPISNTQVYIMDGMKLCGIGIPGELCTSGDGVAKGYLNNEDLTNDKFIDNPFGQGKLYRTGDLARWNSEGNIEFLGRIDQQIKLRGFRIELGEIENAISKQEGVKDVVVTVQGEEEKLLCGFVVSSKKIDLQKIRDEISKELPSYMIPVLMEVE
ncbi:TPA: AMP-binding protein, partial [Streptococcus agalactiae]